MYQNSSIEIIYGTGNKAKVEAMKKIIREHDFNVSILSCIFFISFC